MESSSKDALDIFSNDDNATTEVSSSSPSKAVNPFDPLAPGSPTTTTTTSSPNANANQELDLMGQIAGWGAENKHESDATDTTDANATTTSSSPPATPTKVNLMPAPENALELSPEFVQQAHQDFEKSANALEQQVEQS